MHASEFHVRSLKQWYTATSITTYPQRHLSNQHHEPENGGVFMEEGVEQELEHLALHRVQWDGQCHCPEDRWQVGLCVQAVVNGNVIDERKQPANGLPDPSLATPAHLHQHIVEVGNDQEATAEQKH